MIINTQLTLIISKSAPNSSLLLWRFVYKSRDKYELRTRICTCLHKSKNSLCNIYNACIECVFFKLDLNYIFISRIRNLECFYEPCTVHISGNRHTVNFKISRKLMTVLIFCRSNEDVANNANYMTK